MDIKTILEFLRCPSCFYDVLHFENEKIICHNCETTFDVVDEIPIFIQKQKLGLQELKQIAWFNQHYSNFSTETYKLENWRLSMLNRIFNTSFQDKVKIYLDIGCGATGYTAIEAAKRHKWISFGVDISIEAAQKAKKIAQKLGVENHTAFFVSSAENLPFKQNTIDYISAISLLEHLDDDSKVIKSVYNILKKDGHFYICVPNTYKRMWPFLWPIYFYMDRKIGHKRHYAIENLNKRMEKDGLFDLEKVFYNGHLIKFWQLLLEKFNLINDKKWWLIENNDINSCSIGVQLNAIYKKR